MPSLGLGLGFARGPVSSAPAAPILDSLSAAAAYSASRKLRTAYTGAAFRVRRSSDNVEQDIGFSGNSVDTSALTSFIGANSGFIVTWYDQSGNGRNLTQATQANQPRIVNAGVIDTSGGYPAIAGHGAGVRVLTGASHLFAAGAHTVMFVMQRPSDPNGNELFQERANPGSANYLLRANNSVNPTNYAMFVVNDAAAAQLNFATVLTGMMDNGRRVVAIRDNGSSILGHGNGTLITTTNYTRTGVYSMNQQNLTLKPGDFIHEMIQFGSFLSASDFNTVGLNQGAAYGITVNPI